MTTRGFTLVEVLVALAVLAVALSAIVKAGADYAGNQAYLQERSFAYWVARNRLNELLLEPDWPPVGNRDGEVEFAGTEWTWRSRIQATPDEDVRRIDIEVWHAGSDEDDEVPLARLSGFRERP